MINTSSSNAEILSDVLNITTGNSTQATQNDNDSNETNVLNATNALNATNEKDYSHFSFGEACRTAKAPSYLIYSEVKAKGIHMTYGEPSSGKTFYVIDKCASVACEEIDSWHGKPIKHGEVVYFAGEASEGVKIRCKGWAKKRSINPDNVKMIIFDEVFALDDDKDVEHTIETTIKQIRKYAPNAVYVLFDTLHAFMSGDENLAVDARRFLAVCRKIVETFDCAVELIHHVGVSQDAKGRARGSSAWKGAMDIETLVQTINQSNNGITCKLTQNKHKDGKKRKPLIFDMNEVTLDDLIDDAGKPVTTLVPEFDEASTKETASAETFTTNKKKPKKSFTNGIKTFKEAAIRFGRITADYETGQSYVDVELEEWRKVAYEILDGDSASAKRSKFNNAKAALVEDTEPPIITHYETDDGKTFYRLARNGENEPTFRMETFTAVMKRIEDTEKSTKADNISERGGGGGGGEAETDATGNLFDTPDEKL